MLQKCPTDPRGKKSMCTTSPSMPQSCSHCLLMLTRAQADLLLAWQASGRHVVITTITFQMPWTPSFPSQRDQGEDEPIGREVAPRGMPGAGPGPADRPRGTPCPRDSHSRARVWATDRSRRSPLMVRGRCPCAQVRVDRVRVQVPAVIPVFRLQPAPPRPARGYRSKNGEDPSSWARERSRASSGLDR